MAPSTALSSEISSLISTSLAFLSKTITDLSSNPRPAPSNPSPVQDVRNDLIALLTLIGKESTSLSLAFKPPVSVQAVEGTLVKLHALLVKLAFCLSSCPSEGALAKEINWIGLESLEAVQRLLESSLTGYNLTGTNAKKEKEVRQACLNLTGLVWEVVERSKELSVDELQAMRKEWTGVLGLLDDCLEEVKEMEESGEDEEDDEEDDEEEEDEDDFRTSHPLSSTEKARVSAAHFLLRLGRLLLNRLINSTAPPSPLAGFSSPSFLTQSSSIVKSLSASSDDFALSLEPPQEDVEEVVKEFVGTAKELALAFEGAVEGNEAEEKWLKVWRSQLETAVDKLDKVGA
ncbi:hypothetical protein BCR35DRAFT_303566 [Leucosporidium creatinivorum]|uniref:Cyclin-D1-binding protein 1-like N-terminal domain-containing protein n=1 Tax=Leucosporidium creatinivorum TaxID=106004 RepID=A0A1Y2FH31_9BASI|nr:hypothetical protein BCR35DRAFT_303566 [Leucosporidium creatinivorum]